MTLSDVRKLLNENNILFEQVEYENEKEWLVHSVKYPYLKNAKDSKVTTLVIYSNNKHKNIEILFDDNLNFYDLSFGEFDYEMFDTLEELLPEDFMHNIKEIMDGKIHIIEAFDNKKKKWLGDRSYIDDVSLPFNNYEKAIRRIEERKSFFSRLLHSEREYEIYDWNSYRSVIK